MAFIHEASYRGFGLAPLVHRARLRPVVQLVSQLSLPAAGTLADLGCANGIVISQLRDKLFWDKA